MDGENFNNKITAELFQIKIFNVTTFNVFNIIIHHFAYLAYNRKCLQLINLCSTDHWHDIIIVKLYPKYFDYFYRLAPHLNFNDCLKIFLFHIYWIRETIQALVILLIFYFSYACIVELIGGEGKQNSNYINYINT